MDIEIFKSLRCVYCKQKLFLYKLSEISSILNCKCDCYPFINGILYIQKDTIQKKAVHFLRQRQDIEALKTLLNLRLLLLFPVSLLLLPSIFDATIRKIFKKHIYEIIGFKTVIRFLTVFSYPKDWVRYLCNREKTPSYFFSIAATNLVKNMKNSPTALDIGCGTGHLLRILSHKTDPRKIVGIDRSFLNLFFARIFFSDPKSLLICADVEKGLPFINESIDLILTTDCFHNLTNKRYFLNDVNRISKSTGILAVLHTLNNPRNRTETLKGLSPDLFRKMLHEKGFRRQTMFTNTNLWYLLQHNLPIHLDEENSHKDLQECYAYSVIASKKLLPNTINLTSEEKLLLKKTKITYIGDPILLSEFRLLEIINNYDNFIFISPHYDDAVLSCSLLLEILQSVRKKTLVITVFTQASELPFTQQAQKFLKASGYNNANKLFSDRSKEDVVAMSYLGSKFIHLNFIDATWRKSKLFFKFPLIRPLLKYFPSLIHVYPDDKKQFSGQVSNKDISLLKHIHKKVRTIIRSVDNKILLFAPLGVGGHADHIIIRELAGKLKIPTIFWEDYPYNTFTNRLEDFFSEQNQYKLHFEIEKKAMIKKYKAIRMYKSQVPVLFPDNKISRTPERYYTLNESRI